MEELHRNLHNRLALNSANGMDHARYYKPKRLCRETASTLVELSGQGCGPKVYLRKQRTLPLNLFGKGVNGSFTTVGERKTGWASSAEIGFIWFSSFSYNWPIGRSL
jgi:hypothetical protein